MMKPVPIHLAVCCDAASALAVLVLLTSARHNKAAESRYCVHLMLTEPCPGLEEQLRQLEAEDFQILPQVLSNSHPRLQAARFGCLELCEALPEVDKLLYLDSAGLVLRDLSSLYQTVLGDALLAVVFEPDCFRKERFSWCAAVLEDAPGFCTGVLLMNLSAMRRQRWEEKARNLLLSLPQDWELTAQDVADTINYVSHGHIRSLPLTHRQAVDELNEAAAPCPAAFVQFPGCFKPWNYAELPCRGIWQRYLTLSPGSGSGVPTAQAELPEMCDKTRLCVLLVEGAEAPDEVMGSSGSLRLFGFLPRWRSLRKEGRT